MVKNVAKTLDVKSGDVLITSEYSSMFPQGIRVGIVSEVTEQEGTLFKSVTIAPAVDFVKLEEVFVILATPNAERLELNQRAHQRFGR